MTSGQRAAKGFAIGFAVFIMVLIFSAVIALIVGVTDGKTSIVIGDNSTKDISKDFIGVRSLKISNGAGKLNIKDGDMFRVEAKNVLEDFTLELAGDTLVVDIGKDGNWIESIFSDYNESVVTINVYIPEDFVAEDVKLSCGSGRVEIENLRADDMELDTGSASFSAELIQAQKLEFDTGSGRVSVKSLEYGRSDMDFNSGSVNIDWMSSRDAKIKTGSGHVSMEGNFFGETELKTGSGAVVLNIEGNRFEYDIETESGSGGIWVDGDKDPESENVSGVTNSLKIDGGSGRVSVKFE